MNKKRASIFIVTLLVLSITLTGCGVNAVGFFNHLNEIQDKVTTKSTQTVSTLSVSELTFPAQLVPTEQKEVVKALTKVLDEYYITTTQTMNPTKNIISISLDTVKKQSGEKEHLFTLNYKDRAFAFSKGPKLTELLKSASPEIQAVVAASDNKLILVSALEQALGGQQMVLSSFTNPKGLLDVNEKSMTFLKEFTDIFVNADVSPISKQDNSFVFQMDTPEFVTFIDSFVSMTLENTEPILNTTMKFYESLTEEEFNMLYGQILPGGKTEIIALLKEALNQPIPAETAELWNNLYHAEIAPTLLSTMDGSSLRMRTWKENEKYYTNTYGIIKIGIPDNPNMNFSGTLFSKEEMKIISDDFDVTMPTEFIQKRVLKALLPEPILIEETTVNTEAAPE